MLVMESQRVRVRLHKRVHDRGLSTVTLLPGGCLQSRLPSHHAVT